MVDTKKLEAVATRLNKESDSINATIQKVEDKLNELNIGLEVWNENELIAPERIDLENEESPYPQATRGAMEWWLGYGKVSSEKWGLIVQEKAVYYGPSSYNGEEIALGIDDYKRTHLVKASRTLRIKALSRLQGLIDNIHKAAEEALNDIEEARKLANEL